MPMTNLPKSRAKTAYGLLSEIRALILAEPLRYNQRVFILREVDEEYETLPACGTIGCVAGWVATLKRSRRFTYDQTPGIANRILGLDGGQTHELFASWAAGITESQTKEHARNGAAHIARFQRKYRAQLLAKKV